MSDLATHLPEGYVLLSYTAAIKALDADGEVVLINTSSDDLTAWEALGMLIYAADALRDSLRAEARGMDT